MHMELSLVQYQNPIFDDESVTVTGIKKNNYDKCMLNSSNQIRI